MVESQLAVAPAAHIGSLADWLDLDGHLLLAGQPYVGLELSDGRVLPPDLPGLVLAKLTHGFADDLVTTLCLATIAPISIAPAMNHMNCHGAT